MLKKLSSLYSSSIFSRNPSTLTFLLEKCRSMADLKRIHALTVTLGLSQDDFYGSKILAFCAISNSGDIDYSYRVFRQLPNPTIFNWNTILRGYSRSQKPIQTITIFNQMLQTGVPFNHLTFPFLAKACARLVSPKLGLAVHSCIAKTGFELDKFISNSLIHMYATFGDIISARKVFDDMPLQLRNLVTFNSMIDGYAKCGDMVSARETFEMLKPEERDVVSWSSLIDGYVKTGNYRDALAVLERMQWCGLIKANEVTMVSVLCACAHLGALQQGRMMHKYVKDNKLRPTLVLQTSLVDMYAKCGAIHEALCVFHGIPVEQTDVLIWNAMIGGLATHGLVKESLQLFADMQATTKIAPDEITYLCLLSACSHGGLVDEAWYFFRSLSSHGMTPMLEHYACMVDVLGRSGRVDEAYEFLDRMPVEPTASMFGALLSGCKKHGRLDLGEVVGKRLIELEPDHDGRYIGLSNVYAFARRWKEAKTMREAMEKRGVKKSPGCSSVEVNGILHNFIAHDKTHPQATQVYIMLKQLTEEMKLDDEHQVQQNFSFHIEEDGWFSFLLCYSPSSLGLCMFTSTSALSLKLFSIAFQEHTILNNSLGFKLMFKLRLYTLEFMENIESHCKFVL